MLLINLLFAVLIIFAFIAFNIFLGIYILNKNLILNFFRRRISQYIDLWKKWDTDYKIIVFTSFIGIIGLCLIYVTANKDAGLQSVFSIMMQFIGLSLATVAAIIAFRNYRRKSGDKLSYVSGGNKRNIAVLILRNEKDKTTSIFAIDAVLKSGEIVRLVNFFWPIINPKNLSAFETKKIELGKVHLYGDRNPSDLNMKEIEELICITANGPIPAERFPIDALRPAYVEKKGILLANRIKNIVSGYENKDIDPAAEYWLYFEDGGSINGSSWEEEHVLTGFLSEHVFYLTKDSINYINKPNKTTLKQYCLENIHAKKVAGKYSLIDKAYDESGEYLINGFFWEFDSYRTSYPADYYSYCILKKIEIIEINNSYD